MSKSLTPLLIGEVFVDFTVTAGLAENKLRLGGIAHAARGFWATGVTFRAAAILPSYLVKVARRYFAELGCIDFQIIGTIEGAPNVIVIFDASEVADQGYEALLRDEKVVHLTPTGPTAEILSVEDALIFPGSYDLRQICALLPPSTRLHIDVGYDVDSPSRLEGIEQPIETILISTSSRLFLSMQDGGITSVLRAFSSSKPATVILKENRGGARLVMADTGEVETLPAQLGTTVNSVGVGDVFAAAYLAYLKYGRAEAAWRATYASAAYSQTTEPDLFKAYVTRDARLSLEEMRELGGALLPWESRPNYQIYFAAPDFKSADRKAIDKALGSLSYHNFKVRRPVVENGELPAGSDDNALQQTYRADYDLLKACSLVFAVPTGRDPGTLVEIGIAIEASIPVIVYDPQRECANTMVIAGSYFYSSNLDICLNATFGVLSRLRAKR